MAALWARSIRSIPVTGVALFFVLEVVPGSVSVQRNSA